MPWHVANDQQEKKKTNFHVTVATRHDARDIYWIVFYTERFALFLGGWGDYAPIKTVLLDHWVWFEKTGYYKPRDRDGFGWADVRPGGNTCVGECRTV